MRPPVVLGVWIAGLAAAVAALLAAGHGALAGPPIGEPAAWSAWARGRDPVDAAFAIARTGALVVAGYLLVLTVVGVLARLASLPRLVAGIDLAGGPVVRAVLRSAVGAGVVASTLAPAVGATAGEAPPPTAVMRLLDDVGPATTTTTVTTTTMAIPSPSAVATPPPPPPQPPAPPAAHDDYVVKPGDSFWRIAREHVAATLERAPSDVEVFRYWRTLVAANADRLIVPSEPDLIHPGQRLVLP
jgi:hypothetical protein